MGFLSQKKVGNIKGLLFALVSLLLLCVTAFVEHRTISSQEQEIFAVISSEIGKTVYGALKNSMLAYDPTLAHSIIRVIKDKRKDEGIQNVRVINKFGDLMISSVKAEEGNHYGQEEQACIVCHGSRGQWKQKGMGIETRYVVQKEAGERTLQIFVPVVNEKACKKCHDSQYRLNGIIEIEYALGKVERGLGTFRKRSMLFGAVTLAALMVALGFVLEKVAMKPMGEMARSNIQLESQRRNLSLMNEELERAIRQKTEFMASMSHELRTPLNSIIGFSAVLMSERLGDVEERQKMQFYENIHSSGVHLLNLVNSFLDLSKVEAGKMEVVRKRFFVPQVCREVSAMMQSLAEEKRIHFAAEVDEEVGHVSLDEEKFKEILLNLLSNAIKFTPPDGHVTLTVSRAGKELVVVVSDTGLGILAEDQHRIFEPFLQVDKSLAKDKGTGLGLAITKRFTELLGGWISVKSARGSGSVFTVHLPYDEAEESPEAESPLGDSSAVPG